MSDFVMRQGTQRRTPQALLSLVAVRVDDEGRLGVSLAIGTPGGRRVARLVVGEAVDVPGLGAVTLRDVQVAAGRAGSAAFTTSAHG